MRTLLFFLVTAAAFAQAGPQPPFVLPDSVSLERDILYARTGSRALHLDLFLPRQGAGPFPAVVYIHGGGWRNGSKEAFQRQAAYMATKGFAGACIEYRLSGEAVYPAALDDAKAAVRWMRLNAKRNRMDPGRIGAAGGSAGGHLAAMLGTTGGLTRFEGNSGNSGVSSSVQAVAAFNPVLDLSTLGKQFDNEATRTIALFLGKSWNEAPELWADASPFTHVGPASAPMLLLHGDADTTVPYEQSVAMLARLKAAGVDACLYPAKAANHGFFNAPPWFVPALEQMEKFFVRVLKR